MIIKKLLCYNENGIASQTQTKEEQFPEEIRPQRWSLDVLAYFPEQFQISFKLDPKTKKQFNILRGLMERKDVEAVIHGGDSDREGEAIIRLILLYSQNSKLVYSLWLPEQTEETIWHEMRNLKSDCEYDSLYKEGMTRAYIDWMYGINLTRYVTLMTPEQDIYNIGCVLTPIVAAIQ